jgi:hypothetical protein
VQDTCLTLLLWGMGVSAQRNLLPPLPLPLPTPSATCAKTLPLVKEDLQGKRKGVVEDMEQASRKVGISALCPGRHAERKVGIGALCAGWFCGESKR